MGMLKNLEGCVLSGKDPKLKPRITEEVPAMNDVPWGFSIYQTPHKI